MCQCIILSSLFRNIGGAAGSGPARALSGVGAGSLLRTSENGGILGGLEAVHVGPDDFQGVQYLLLSAYSLDVGQSLVMQAAAMAKEVRAGTWVRSFTSQDTRNHAGPRPHMRYLPSAQAAPACYYLPTAVLADANEACFLHALGLTLPDHP